MPATEPALLFTRRLGDLGIRYMVSGSVAAIFYGEPRFTNDVDIIVWMNADHVEAMIDAFPLDEFYCPPKDVVLLELERRQRGHFNLIHHETGFKADIYPIRSDPLHLWGIKHAREVSLEGESVYLAPPEYVIVRKLQFYREGGSEKHLRDIHRMMAGLGPDLDRTTLTTHIDKHGLQSEWRAAQDYAS